MDDLERRERLCAWFEAGHRDLPWRRTRDPWAVWVSEIMLQQTRAASVVPYYYRFLARFPTPAALSAAPIDDLLALWAGLGYYARARNLHRAAGEVVARHGGRVPDDPETFGALTGVGPYTAGAVLSIAFGRPAPVLDGNVERVLTRWAREGGDPKRPPLRDALWARARSLADGPAPGTLNQALMELGATICTPRTPSCLLCPVVEGCAARAAGDPEAYPRKVARAERPVERYVALLAGPPEGVWLVRRPDTGLLAGLWELPLVEDGPALEATVAAAGFAFDPAGERRAVTHAFTHRIWEVDVVRASGRPSPEHFPRARLVPNDGLADAALTGPALKALHAWEVTGAPQRRGAGRAR